MRKTYLNLKAFTALVALLAVFSLTVLPVGAQQNPPAAPVNSISVSGTGEASGTPDVAYINLGTDTVDADVALAVAQANTDMAAIITAITDTGVAAEDIKTVSFNVYPEDRYDQNGQPTGERVYHVQNSLNVTVRDISKVGDVISVALQAGADSVNGLSFGIADTSALEQEARQSAVADARERAQQLADVFGVTLGDPIIISEVTGQVYPPIPYAADVAMGGAGGPQITPGQLQVSVTINVTFAIAS